MKKIIVLATMLLSVPAVAASVSQGSDSIRTKSGTLCSSQVAVPTLSFSLESEKEDKFGRGSTESFDSHGGSVMITYTVPLDSNSRKRLDCDRLYEVELERAELELQQLRMAVEQQRQALIQQQWAAQQPAQPQQPAEPEVDPIDLFAPEAPATGPSIDISKFTEGK